MVVFPFLNSFQNGLKMKTVASLFSNKPLPLHCCLLLYFQSGFSIQQCSFTSSRGLSCSLFFFSRPKRFHFTPHIDVTPYTRLHTTLINLFSLFSFLSCAFHCDLLPKRVSTTKADTMSVGMFAFFPLFYYSPCLYRFSNSW